MFLSSFQVSGTVCLLAMAVHVTSEMHFNASQCKARPNTTLLECMLYHNESAVIQALHRALERVLGVQSTKDTD